MPSVYIKTYGCQMNERDSEAVAAQLVAKGYTLALSEATADVILLNTCSVRDMAEQKAIGKMAHARRRRAPPPAQRRARLHGLHGAKPRHRNSSTNCRTSTSSSGTQKFHRTAEYLDDIFAGRREKIVDVAAEAGSEASIREHLLERQRARNPSPRSSASCKAATSIAPSASCLTPAARSAAGAFRTSWPNAASWSRAA